MCIRDRYQRRVHGDIQQGYKMIKRSIVDLAKTLNFTKKANFSRLTEKLAQVVPQKQAELKEIKEKYGNEVIDSYTVDQTIGGMRSIRSVLWDTSILDANEGIRIRGHTIPELQQHLPKAKGGHEPLPEAVYWLLLTGEYPNEADIKDLQRELQQRAHMTEQDLHFLQNLPEQHHPMTLLSMGILYFQQYSHFAKAYSQGISKREYWKYAHEDSLDLLAKLPIIAASIYRTKYKSSSYIQPNYNLDWAANYAHMLGYNEQEVQECLRGYLSIHSDHEGGNVSAHTSHLVGSALSDPYLSFSAAVNGLAGPLHGLANQEVLKFLLDVREQVGDNPTDDQLKVFVQGWLKSGRVVPGYGHAVLRNTDPRFIHQKTFSERYPKLKNDPLVRLTHQMLRVVPPILQDLGKVKNPWPNVDAHSGVLLYHYDFIEFEYYTVIFAVSRALGCLSNVVWARALGLPLERPNSIDFNWIRKKYGKK
eukprot:TRINITY_DN10_c0_g1_i1.p1 TRINITY_DN10_c0_g1~~TRINITY_DN10_c0_g1_i1.p1  ORF type:complete len:477 (-),score=125.26 TRINITY_DN10_c0_g1_i1:156-1586(-)